MGKTDFISPLKKTKQKQTTKKKTFVMPDILSLHNEHTSHYAASAGMNFHSSQSEATQSTSAFQSLANSIFTHFSSSTFQ